MVMGTLIALVVRNFMMKRRVFLSEKQILSPCRIKVEMVDAEMGVFTL